MRRLIRQEKFAAEEQDLEEQALQYEENERKCVASLSVISTTKRMVVTPCCVGSTADYAASCKWQLHARTVQNGWQKRKLLRQNLFELSWRCDWIASIRSEHACRR